MLEIQCSKENRANEIDWFTNLCGFPIAIMDSDVQWMEQKLTLGLFRQGEESDTITKGHPSESRLV